MFKSKRVLLVLVVKYRCMFCGLFHRKKSLFTLLKYISMGKKDQFCWIGKDCDRNVDRMSKNDEKFPYLH